MTTPTKQSEEERIRRAFGCSLPVSIVPEDEYQALKWDVCSLTLDGVLKWLPLCLIHEIDCVDSNDGDALVYFLDGNKAARGKDAALLREISRPVLESFTREQAEAVRLWLKRVAKRRYWRLCREDIESAMAYWTEREKKIKLSDREGA